MFPFCYRNKYDRGGNVMDAAEESIGSPGIAVAESSTMLRRCHFDNIFLTLFIARFRWTMVSFVNRSIFFLTVIFSGSLLRQT
jgi:hypothetical protein